MQMRREYYKYITRPGIRRSLVEVFLLFFLVIMVAATFFYMTGAELMLEKFQRGQYMDNLPVQTELIQSKLDETIRGIKRDPQFESIEGRDLLLNEVSRRFQNKIADNDFKNKFLEKYSAQLNKTEGELLYLTALSQEARQDINSTGVQPGQVLTVFSNRPVVILIPLLMIVLALLMAPRILKPVKQLTIAAEKLTRGDFETPIKIKEEDELGILADMFEKMRMNLKQKILELQNTAFELAMELEEKNVMLEKAKALQMSFVPEYLEKGSLKIATSLMLCEEVGGDFFDIQELGSGKISFIFGDVEGHGIRASFNMMSILTIFRVMAHESSDPEILAMAINEMICREREDPNRRFSATAIIGLIDQHTGTLKLVNAGHPNPIFWNHRLKKTMELPEGNPLFGIQADFEYNGITLPVNDNDRLMLYTDGLIWSTDKKGEFLGAENLLTIFASDHDLPVEQLVTRISEKIKKFRTPKQANDDDILFTIFSFEPEIWSYLEIPPCTKDSALEEIITNLTEMNISNDLISDFRLAMDELITNAIKHGNKNDPEKRVFIKYTVHHGFVKMVVQDEGDGFPRDISTFLLDRDNLYEPGKRGIYLVKSLMDEMIYNDKGNEVTISKRINGEW
jgi:serine phosphatase RsbU (regulator of sigma subunit)/anti-sigma regulatory factor (Ser/Thr protein kinase)